MPARDLSGPLLAAVITQLMSDSAVSAIVGPRVYDYVPASPVYPFIRCLTAIVTPFEATGGIRGGLVLVQVDTFTKDYGTTQVNQLNGAVAECLDETQLSLSEGNMLDIAWQRSKVIADPTEQGAWHGVVEFEALASN